MSIDNPGNQRISGVFSLSKIIIKFNMTSHIRDFLNPISGSRIPFPGNISHTRDFTISHFRESYPTYGNLLHPTLGSHIPNVGIRNIPF